MWQEENSRKLSKSIVDFLKTQLTKSDLSIEHIDNLESAIECLQSVYQLNNLQDNQQRPRPLLDMFLQLSNPVSIKDKLRAESLKEEGNTKMDGEQYIQAEQDYSHAIELDRFNAIFYCCRAGARIELQRYLEAISDCRRALMINPDYVKAHERMGQAYALLGRHKRASRCFRLAMALEPDDGTHMDSYLDQVKQFLMDEERDAEEDPAGVDIESDRSSGITGDGLDESEEHTSSQELEGTTIIKEEEKTEADSNDAVSNDDKPSENSSFASMDENLIVKSFEQTPSKELEDTIEEEQNTCANHNTAVSNDDKPSEKPSISSMDKNVLIKSTEQAPSQELEGKEKQNPEADSNDTISKRDDKPSEKSLIASMDENVLVESTEQTPSQETESKASKDNQKPVFSFLRNFRRSSSKTKMDKSNDRNETKKKDAVEVLENEGSKEKHDKTNANQEK